MALSEVGGEAEEQTRPGSFQQAGIAPLDERQAATQARRPDAPKAQVQRQRDIRQRSVWTVLAVATPPLDMQRRSQLQALLGG